VLKKTVLGKNEGQIRVQLKIQGIGMISTPAQTTFFVSLCIQYHYSLNI